MTAPSKKSAVSQSFVRTGFLIEFVLWVLYAGKAVKAVATVPNKCNSKVPDSTFNNYEYCFEYSICISNKMLDKL